MSDEKAMRRLCGQLIVGGFEGTSLTPSFARALSAGERGGAILFARNLTDDPMTCANLARTIADAAPRGLPPLVGIDQEGGRVARLKAPILKLPPMRVLGDLGDVALLMNCAEALARQLAALGFTIDFAPVLDVSTLASNPIIGDRAFSDDPSRVDLLGSAFARGLARGGVAACGKHFPGHGHTSVDSHLDLPVDARDETGLVTGALAGFRSAASGDVAALMTAHVLYPAFDAEWPATLSPAILSRAREELGFKGCFVSDDLEMKAVADRWLIEDSAVRAVAAGCDVLLICRSEELQERAVAALAKRASEDIVFADRCQKANARFLALRTATPPRPVATRAAFDEASAMARAVEAELLARLARSAS